MLKRLLIILLFISAVVGGFFVFTWVMATPQVKALTNPVVQTTPKTYPQVNGRTLGDEATGIKIEVFEDFQCPACNTYAQTVEPQVIEKIVAAGKAYYIFRNYPFLDSRVPGGKESHQAASAAMCASDQGKFWEFKDLLFANQKAENSGGFSDDRLLSFAGILKLDIDKFNLCFNAYKYKPTIEADYRIGYYAKIGGTPAVFVNGVNVKPGFVPSYDDIAAAVEAAKK